MCGACESEHINITVSVGCCVSASLYALAARKYFCMELHAFALQLRFCGNVFKTVLRSYLLHLTFRSVNWFVYNGCIHSCQLQKHRRPFNRIQPFLIKPLRTSEQREQNAADWSGTGVWEPSDPSDSPAALCFSHTHTDRTWASSHLQRFHRSASAFTLIPVLTYDL